MRGGVPQIWTEDHLIRSQTLYNSSRSLHTVLRPHWGDTSQLAVGLISAPRLNFTWQRQFGPAGLRKWAGIQSCTSICICSERRHWEAKQLQGVFLQPTKCRQIHVGSYKSTERFLMGINPILLLLMQKWCLDENKSLQLISKYAGKTFHMWSYGNVWVSLVFTH